MRWLFADTSFYVALLDDHDGLFAIASEVARDLHSDPLVRFVTMDAVILEFMAYFASAGEHMRTQAVRFVRRLEQSAVVTIVPITAELMDDGLRLYDDRRDKSYGLADCISMTVCRQLGITHVVTHDHDFEQERLTILL